MADLVEICIRLGSALAIGALIGLERSYRGRPAGFRTHALVCLASSLLMLVTVYESQWFTPTGTSRVVVDPTRMAQGIMTGIGFLGAGAIIRQGLSVRGLTTAAGLWVVAAIGMAVGAGYYSAALIATAIVLVGLGPFRWVERAPGLARFRRAGGSLEVDLTPEHSITEPLAVVDARRVRISRVEFEDQKDRRRLRIQLDVPLGQAEERLVEDLAALEGVVAVRWAE